MHRILLICLIVFFKLSTYAQHSTDTERGYLVKVGDKVESFELRLTTGDVLTNKDLVDKVVVLQFTASWCSVCRKEMPHLEKDIWQKYKDDDFILIGVDYDESLEKVIEFGKQMKVTYPLALDPGGKIFHRFASKGAGVTRNVVIDKNGKIAFLTRLFDMAEFQAMSKKIEELLNE